MVDQELAEWRDTAIQTASRDAINYYLDRLPAARETDARELVSIELLKTLVRIGLVQLAKWTAELDADRVEGEMEV
jgi:hypothetical protein